MSQSTVQAASEEMQTKNEAMDTTDTADDLESAKAAANKSDEDDRKLFAGGLPQDAKEADIREHFGQYGEIDTITLKTDPTTGRSRGFCFVVYKEVAGVDAAVLEEVHEIKGKKVAVKKAQAKQGKVYVGKLVAELTDDQIKDHFAQFGTIANIEQPFDKIKNERKNFCFITFEKEEVAKKLLKEGTVYIDAHELEIKKVTPKPDPRQMMMGGYGGPPMGGMRGGGQGRGGHWNQGGYGGQWGNGYDQWGGYGGGYDYYGGNQAYAGYGGYGGGNGYPGGYGAGGKTPRGAGAGPQRGGGGRGGFVRGARGAPRGAGAQRQKPY